MSDALVGVLIGLFGSVLVQVLLQAILLWRDQRERARSVRVAPLANLLSVVDSVTEVLSMFTFRSSGVSSERLLDAALNAVMCVQRASVSMVAINGPSEVFAALNEVSSLLPSVVTATGERQVALVASIAAALSRIEGQYLSLRLSSDKLVFL